MGIQGLLPQLKNIQNPVSLNRYSGETLAIDGYAWLHRATFSCAHDLVLGNPTDKYLQFFIKKFAMLKSYNIQPYLVFDGNSLPVKKQTEVKRKEKRTENRSIAIKLWNSGERRNAMEYFQKSVDVTPEMAKCVIDYCKLHGIKYVVAPYEADPQLVYLEKHKIVHGIISEDSDLLVFGCRKLITKLNDFGECIEICRDNFNQVPKKFPIYELTDDQIRVMVCLSGCDYTDGILKIGLIRAIKLVRQHKTMDKIILALQREGKSVIPKTFLMEYYKACLAFQYQRVYCPNQKKIVSLNDLTDEVISKVSEKYEPKEMFVSIGLVINKHTKTWDCILNDTEVNHELHTKIARGELSPYDFNKNLVNREHKLQIQSKSDLSTASTSAVTTTSATVSKSIGIENYFSKTTENTNKAISTNYKTEHKKPIIDKISQCVKRRKLISNVQNINYRVDVRSKFFSGGSTITANTALLSATQSSNGWAKNSDSNQDSVDTDIPDSELPTQISSSYPILSSNQNISKPVAVSFSQTKPEASINVISVSNVIANDGEDTSEILSEVDDSLMKPMIDLVELDDQDENTSIKSDERVLLKDMPSEKTERSLFSSQKSATADKSNTKSLTFFQQFKYSPSQVATQTSNSISSRYTADCGSNLKSHSFNTIVNRNNSQALDDKENRLPSSSQLLQSEEKRSLSNTIIRKPLSISNPNKLKISKTLSLSDHKLTQSLKSSQDSEFQPIKITNALDKSNMSILHRNSIRFSSIGHLDDKNISKVDNRRSVSSLSKFIYKDK
ncbi:hypothetical protein TPHA_0C00380 [Tetrapisispora phaffii CBS 4417]|uniref:Uncharacterized protein n=1 Tax=Tetrapisispora phaffii (strain ATCC 24235 / CBS 4417 / NBRC 1672 / NRRL Y-8282 / UCD 70-5) TaxID=1071381 RepID=G8BR19_TETPH|nr:hypothetical protein TPHA_0C00380 [Tetrapisispora phaffii CBS 4417]CCE62195.1 hypothetical protein TPHA_0C00380 [Tetrapisispora phaffii CBS 4417]